jgi:hypothetical protein
MKQAQFYTWPSAEDAQATEEDWEALEAVFSQEEVDEWRDLGAYLGYRVVRDCTGNWLLLRRDSPGRPTTADPRRPRRPPPAS